MRKLSNHALVIVHPSQTTYHLDTELIRTWKNCLWFPSNAIPETMRKLSNRAQDIVHPSQTTYVMDTELIFIRKNCLRFPPDTLPVLQRIQRAATVQSYEYHKQTDETAHIKFSFIMRQPCSNIGFINDKVLQVWQPITMNCEKCGDCTHSRSPEIPTRQAISSKSIIYENPI